MVFCRFAVHEDLECVRVVCAYRTVCPTDVVVKSYAFRTCHKKVDLSYGVTGIFVSELSVFKCPVRQIIVRVGNYVAVVNGIVAI